MDNDLPKQRWHELSPHRLEEFYLPTQDNWYPNFERNTVRVSVVFLAPRQIKSLRSALKTSDVKEVRISVWGADDFGMERDEILPEDKKLAAKRLKEIRQFARNMPNPLNQDWLEANKFVRA